MTNEIEQIKKAIAALEVQRSLLGDGVVDTALAPLRAKLNSLQPQPGAEQRKLVTVLFADLVGFTSMSEKMDPEDVREIVNSYFTRWSGSIGKYGGVVEKFIGDAVMSVFGLTVSREDDPENAIRAALDMRQALVDLNKEFDVDWGLQLAMRIGIHTGLAVITLLGERPSQREGQDFVAVGDTVNLASRLQTAAPGGGILISHDTYRHVRGIFDVQVQAPIKVKGKEEPIQVYLVLRAKQRAFHSPSRGVEGIETRMFGRDVELQQLKDALSTAIERRRTQIVTIVGEAGIGKSRLIAEFDNWLELLPQVVRYFKCRASPLMENLPYSLLRDMISYRFQIQDSDPPQVVEEKIEKGMVEFGRPDNQRRALFIGHLLGYRLPGNPALEGALRDPQTFRDTALVYLLDYFKDITSIRTVVLMLEDIHWADDSSLDLLERLLERLPDLPLLLVCAARPLLYERRPKWGEKGTRGSASLIRIDLKPLSPQDSQGLIDEILQNVEAIPVSLHSLIIDSAEGNPFFMEEFIKMLIENGIILKEDESWRIDLTRLANVQIPATLVEVLQARFDSLSLEERVLLQRASVVGRIFWDNAVGSMETAQEDQVQLTPRMDNVLRALSSREMIFPIGSSAFESTREFIFKHALLRDVTYESVLKRLRKIYHAYAAAWLEAVTQRSGRSDEYAALIAEHYERADDLQKARAWYQNAGTRAAERYANAEGIRCLSHCLELIPKEDLADRYELLLRRVRLYDTIADRQSQKRDLETLQAIAEQLDRGTSAEKAPQDHPTKSYRAEIFLQWWHYYDALSDFQASIAAAQQAIVLAQASGDTGTEASGYLFFGASSWRQSSYPTAKTYLERSLSLSQQVNDHKLEGDILRNLGIVLQYQGNYEEAGKHYDAALRIYHDTGNERGESMALNSLGTLFFDQGRLREARKYLEQSLELKKKIGHRRAEHNTLNNLGLVASKMGRYVEASHYYRQVLRFSSETGDLESLAEALNSLGSVAVHLGDYAAAKEHLERASLTYGEYDSKTGICDTLLTQAMLAHHLGDQPSALQHSQEAFSLAQEQNLKEEQAYALTFAGYALLSLDRIKEAFETLQKALSLWQELGKAKMLTETRAAFAYACLAGGKREKALELAEEVLTSLVGFSEAGLQNLQDLAFSSLEGIDEPFGALLNCYRIFASAGDQHSAPLLEAAHRLLQEQASWIDDESLRKSFLENIPAHKEIIAQWKKKTE